MALMRIAWPAHSRASPRVRAATAGLMKLLEPLMIVILGGIIGTIVTAMYLPMYAILQKIG